MAKWKNVIRYAGQLEALERDLVTTQTAGTRIGRVQDDMRKERFRRAMLKD